MFFNRNNRKSKLSDEELVNRFKKSGDQYFLALLFERYLDLITAISLRYLNEKETEDAVMGIYEIIENDLRKYKVKSFNNWLYSVVKNHCLKVKRQSDFVLNVAFQDQHNQLMESLDFTYDPIKDQMIASVGNAMSQLNDEQRKCLELFYWEEKSYKEIEQITGYEIKKVKSYIQNGKRNLKKEIEIS